MPCIRKYKESKENSSSAKNFESAETKNIETSNTLKPHYNTDFGVHNEINVYHRIAL